MSEKIYACLLRLFPSQFRQSHGEDALQLFRDRLRDESGFFVRCLLWSDLLLDLAVSLPREYRRSQPVLVAASVTHHAAGVPLFFVLEEGRPPSSALFSGCAITLAGLGLFSVLLGHAGNLRRLNLTGSGAAQFEGSANRSSRVAPSVAAQESLSGSSLENSPAKDLQPSPPGAASDSGVVPSVDNAKLDPDRERVLNAVIANLRLHYLDPALTEQMASSLLSHARSGDDRAATDGYTFAYLLTSQMRDVSQDMHLEVAYSSAPIPDHPSKPSSKDLAHYRDLLLQDNCAFKKVKLLPHNIGYLKLDVFADPTFCSSTAVSAMRSLDGADAIIFDLRDNRGGSSGMVNLLASYLFDHPEYMYDPRATPALQSFTQSPVPGSNLAHKPVYILTSTTTVSAAEQFCYDLKMLRRATLVGETTHGSAHAGVLYRIDDHFGMGIPEVRPVNPYSTPDWEGTGVQPDITVPAASALSTTLSAIHSSHPQ
jgi:Peptidase family S41